MSLISNVTCPKCHHQYPATKSRCPYCDEEKPVKENRAVPEAGSAAKAAGNMNLQMIVGAVLLICIVVAVIALISVNVGSRVQENQALEATQEEDQDAEEAELAAATPVPTSTPEPTPSPTPQPTVTSISVTFMGTVTTGFSEQVGDEIQLGVTYYPANIEDVTVEWSSSDESVATVSEDGLVTLVGSGYCTVTAAIGTTSQSIEVWST